MSKVKGVLSFGIVICCLFYYGVKWRSFGKRETSASFKFELPQVPSITERQKMKFQIGNPSVWGLKPLVGKTIIPSERVGLKNVDTSNEFVYKKVKGVPSLCKTGGGDYRWEFYGTLERHRERFAIFYNPGVKTIKLVRERDSIDTGLSVVELTTDEVKVKKKEDDVVTLKIFDSEGNKQKETKKAEQIKGNIQRGTYRGKYTKGNMQRGTYRGEHTKGNIQKGKRRSKFWEKKSF